MIIHFPNLADPDLVSGAFLTPGSGSGDPGWVKIKIWIGVNITDHISESLETIFWDKILKFFDADMDRGNFLTLDPESGMEKIRIRDPG